MIQMQPQPSNDSTDKKSCDFTDIYLFTFYHTHVHVLTILLFY